MTITSNDRRKEYPGNGVADTFDGPRAFSASDVEVYLVDDTTGEATLQTAYTLEGVGKANTVITMTTPPPSGQTLRILRTVELTQPTRLTNQGAYLPETIEGALDWLAMQTQQVSDDLNEAKQGSAFEASEIATEAAGSALSSAASASASALSASEDASAADASATDAAASESAAALSEAAAALSEANAATSATVAATAAFTYETWTDLNGVTGTVGQGAQVIDDAGTHTDPVVGGTVDNAGQYVWSASPAGWKWVRDDGLSLMASKVELGLVSDSLNADTFTTGYAAGAIPDGTTHAGPGTYTLNVPIPVDGSQLRFAVYGRAAGTVYVQVASRSGADCTIEAETAVSVALGYQELTVSLPYSAGQYLGFRTTGGVVAIAVGTPAYRYWSSGSQIADGGSYTDAIANATIFHARFTTFAQPASGLNVKALQDSVGTASDVETWLGGLGSATPVDESALGPGTYVFANPVTRDSLIKRIRAYVRSPGTLYLRRFTKAGNDFTATGVDYPVLLPTAGLVEVEVTDNLVLEAGEHLGITKSAGVVALTTATPNGGGYFSGPADSSAFTDASEATTYTIQVGIESEPYNLSRRIDRLDRKDAVLPETPSGYIVVWGLGESHMAGRGEQYSQVTLPAGVAYKYTRSGNTLDAMTDPTGNDGSGTGSMAPALADSVWRLSGGTLGVIFVNSGLGGSTVVNQWASGAAGWTTAVSDWAAATALIAAASLPVVGVGACLAIGSNDAFYDTTKSAFKAGVLDLCSRIASTVGAGGDLPIVLSQTGNYTDGSNATEVGYIREAQNEIVAENPSIFMGWAGAKTLVARGLMKDNVHYKQIGNDESGRSNGVTLIARAVGKTCPAVG